MNVLITGIAGHLGSSFAKWLFKHVPEVKIFGIDDLSSGYIENIHQNVNFVKADICNDGLINSPYDYIFHFAAYAAEGLSPFIRKYNYNNNLISTINVINGALNHGCKRLIYTSSMAVYGNGYAPFYENDNCEPIDPYGNAKLACERDIQIAAIQHGLNYCIIRPHNIYGPNQSIWAEYRNVLGLWMRAALDGKNFKIFGDGNQSRAFTYIDDILPCFWLAAISPQSHNQVINLGNSNPVSINCAINLLSNIIGYGKCEYVESRHEVKLAFCSNNKSKKLLNYTDKTDLKYGLIKMWEWVQKAYVDYPERRSNSKNFEFEITNGLYSYWQK